MLCVLYAQHGWGRPGGFPGAVGGDECTNPAVGYQDLCTPLTSSLSNAPKYCSCFSFPVKSEWQQRQCYSSPCKQKHNPPRTTGHRAPSKLPTAGCHLDTHVPCQLRLLGTRHCFIISGTLLQWFLTGVIMLSPGHWTMSRYVAFTSGGCDPSRGEDLGTLLSVVQPSWKPPQQNIYPGHLSSAEVRCQPHPSATSGFPTCHRLGCTEQRLAGNQPL